MGKHYTDRDRLDMVKKYRQSGLGLSEFARQEHINRSTIKDWVSAYNHLQGDFIRLDNLDSKQNLALYMAKMANILAPLYHQMKDDLLHNQAKVIHADETTLSISKRPEADKDRKKSYVYVYTSSYYDQQIAIYDFHESRAIDRTAAWLLGYEGRDRV